MNTADRSVEALDTALRRRFSFEEMPPKYNLPELKYSYEGVEIAEMLKAINKRIEKLLDKDHQIGHSYFMLKNGQDPGEKLITAFYKNIIPLLQEYFFGDYGKIGLVLGDGFVTIKAGNGDKDFFGDFEHESAEDFHERTVYEIVDYRDENHRHKLIKDRKEVAMTFEKAIQRLMRKGIE
jgi:5-methylcytosine-specific restriction protein B